jgi:hypothetical protein
MRPAMDRKIFSAFAPAKHHQRANMNESFKKGLRNALTGLYVSDNRYWMGRIADRLGERQIVLVYLMNVSPRILFLRKMRL